MTHILTKPPIDRSMQRQAKAAVHTDQPYGSHELFIWLTNVIEMACSSYNNDTKDGLSTPPPHYSSLNTDSERIPYDSALGYVEEFTMLTLRALSIGQYVGEPYGSVLAFLIDCSASEHGRQAEPQCRGAAYKQLALVSHQFGWSKAERVGWCEITRSIPLSDRHASHLIGHLGREGRRAA